MLSPEEVAKNEPMLTRLAQSLPLRIRLQGLKPEEVLGSFKPEDRLAGLAPEDRLTDLPPEHTVLALPDSMLARLPESFLATLPADVQDAVRPPRALSFTAAHIPLPKARRVDYLRAP